MITFILIIWIIDDVKTSRMRILAFANCYQVPPMKLLSGKEGLKLGFARNLIHSFSVEV